MKNILHKKCNKCGKTFFKKPNHSINYWKTKNFCSIRCGKLDIKHTVKTKDKMSASRKKYYLNPDGKKVTSEALKKQWKNGFKGPTGKHWKKTKEQIKNKLGDKNPAWKGGITPENKKIRNSVDYELWRIAVFARDNFTCQKTGERGVKLNAHHVKNFTQYPELRFAINNGITFSDKAHKEFHRKYGRINNTLEQLEEFLNYKI